MKGTVKFFNQEKGWGFIAANGKDYFAHYGQINGTGRRNLVQNETVDFSPAEGHKGPLAQNITRLAGSGLEEIYLSD